MILEAWHNCYYDCFLENKQNLSEKIFSYDMVKLAMHLKNYKMISIQVASPFVLYIMSYYELSAFTIYSI